MKIFTGMYWGDIYDIILILVYNNDKNTSSKLIVIINNNDDNSDIYSIYIYTCISNLIWYLVPSENGICPVVVTWQFENPTEVFRWFSQLQSAISFGDFLLWHVWWHQRVTKKISVFPRSSITSWSLSSGEHPYSPTSDIFPEKI